MRVALTIALLLAAPAAAQGKLYESTRGFRIRVPAELTEVVLEPNERLLLAEWRGTVHGTSVRLWVVRFQLANEAPQTGAADGAAPQSPKEEAEAEFNEAHTLQQLIDKRLGTGTLEVKPGKAEPVKLLDGREARVHEALWKSGYLAMRAYLVNDGREEFGLVAFATFDRPVVGPWVERIAKTLEFTVATARADVGQIAAGLRDPDFRREVRKSLADGWTAHDTENFILITDCTKKPLIDGMLQDLEILRRCYSERFPPLGEQRKVSLVRVFATHLEYTAYSKLDGAIGHFSPLADELLLFDPESEITTRHHLLRDIDPAKVHYHEALHQFLHDANGQLAPAPWFDEGFAGVFGAAELDRSRQQVTRIDKNKVRMAVIKRSQQLRRWPDLRALVKMTQPDFFGPSVNQNFAFAWAFCYFLEQQRLEPGGNREWGAIPDLYLRNLREITAEFRERLPADASREWITKTQFEIQDRTFERTFARTDWMALERAWFEAAKRY